MKAYNHSAIEKKWQKEWARKKIYKTSESSSGTKHKKKYYILDMFPYPSGEGLHVGHPKGYIATDIISRLKRMQGLNVLHPMGWDAFGLPAENYAIKTKTNPRVAVAKNVARYKKQLELLGLDYDWSREVNTTDPKFYKWTQWIFLKLLEHGLAYESYEPVNWCPVDKTVLANEDVEAGKCERCGTQVEKKPLRQWVLSITKYADRMLEDLSLLDWPESIKESQRNWIGRSEGMLFTAPVKDTNLKIQTFSAHFEGFRADTFVVIAPDHPFLKELVKGTPEEKKVLDFSEKLTKERLAEGYENKELKGIFTGRYIVDPVGNGDLPIWVASFALADYGTGIVKCSAHDERDFAFAKKYNIKLKQVFEALHVATSGENAVRPELPYVERNAISAIVKHWSEDKYLALKWKKVDWTTFVTGGIEGNQTAEEAARAEILEETGFVNLKLKRTLPNTHSKFYHVPKKENRFAHFHNFYFELEDGEKREITKEEGDKHEVIWLSPAEVEKFITPPGQLRDFQILHGKEKPILSGILTEPKEFAGREMKSVRGEVIEYLEKNNLAKKKTTYRLKDWVFSRQRYWGEPIPVLHDEGKVVPVKEKDLPIKLPPVKSYEPTGTGESPLAAITKWINVKEGNKVLKRENNTMPQWAGSSWYYLRYMDPNNGKALVGKDKADYWKEVDLYVGGAEHATRHLIYARFWHKFLYDIGVVSYKEPFHKLQSVGLIMGADGRKMSKRFGNVINPDDVIKTYGADSLRLYEMFMGPFEGTIPWSTDNIVGVRRFLERVWKISDKVKSYKVIKENKNLENLLHKTIQKVGEDIENLKFNTAISTMMIFINEVEKNDFQLSTLNFKTFLTILAPFAPHMTEELWKSLAGKGSIHLSEWPKWDPAKVVDDEVKIVVQVNSKVRAEVVVPTNASEEEVKEKALKEPAVLKHMDGQGIKKVIYVKNRLINIVLGE